MEIADTFLYAVNAGITQKHRLVHITGRNASAGTAPEEVMFGGGVRTPLTSAVTMEVISTDVNDNISGANAAVVEIIGTDAEFNQISELINLNGINPTAATIKKFLRVTSASVIQVGTYNSSNIGDITVRVSGGGATQLIIPADTGVDQSSHFTIPKNETGFLVNTRIDIDSPKTASVVLKERGKLNIGGSAPFSPRRNSQIWEALAGNKDDTFIASHIYPEGTDLWAESIAGQNNTAIIFDYDLLLVSNRVLSA